MRNFCLLMLGLTLCFSSWASVSPLKYGINKISDSLLFEKGAVLYTDSVLQSHVMLSSNRIITDFENGHIIHSQTLDFYFLLSLFVFLGFIRTIDSKYFSNLWRAFSNPTLSGRQLKEQLQSAGISNLLMNIFFAISLGSYIYYVIKVLMPDRIGIFPEIVELLLVIIGVALIYSAKYIAIRFSGWAFRVEGVTEHYMFNVFLVNKVIGIMLLPFVVLISFGTTIWTSQIIIISFIFAIIFLSTRYIRSWQVFGSFFQYSKFHFFLYLCASELLPLAILLKLLVKGLSFQ